MNPNWQNFLLSAQADFVSATDLRFANGTGGQRICALAHLGVLTVSGQDAATLLQGQITCNINDVTDTQASLGAICNPKGRAFASFLLVKQADDFHLILPVELLETIRKRLSMFILRSKVSVTDNSDSLCLLGISPSHCPTASGLSCAHTNVLAVQWANRVIILAKPDEAIALWNSHIQQGYQPESTADWQRHDMAAGIPWLTVATSEEYVPQMLNLDQLGGISFTKGCYTGQEIIARTHYLGKTKRGMLLAQTATRPAIASEILNERGETVGYVLAAQPDNNHYSILCVVQLNETGEYCLKLADGSALAIMPFEPWNISANSSPAQI